MAPPVLPVPCARPHRATVATPHDDDPLVALAHVLADDTLAPTAVGVVFDGDTSELHVKPLDDHPVQVLLGLEAPAEWDAFGVVVTGRARAYPGADGPPRVPVGASMVLSFLVDRSNRSVSVMHIEGQAPIVIETDDVDDTVGALSDTCRRVLGLPTPPPERSLAHLWATVWLDRVVERAAADPGARPDWDDVAGLHPALAVLAVHGLAPIAQPGAVLFDAARAFAEVADWADLRDEYLDDAPDSPPDEVLEPTLVAWMDLGMFSRCVLGRLPELADLHAIAAEVLATPVYERVDDALRAWDLLR